MAIVVSMTGFGSTQFSLVEAAPGEGTLQRSFVLDLRSVNGRHAEVRARLPWSAPALEARLVKAVRGRCRRGRIDLMVRPAPEAGGASQDLVEQQLLRSRAVLDGLVARDALPGPVSLQAVVDCAALNRQGRDETHGGPFPEGSEEIVLTALEEVLSSWEVMRRTEGQRMAEALHELIGRAEAYVLEVADLLAGQPERLATRLRERVSKVLSALGQEPDAADRSRLLGEIALLVDRADVTEELVRLRAHFAQVREVLASDGPHGRKLEFVLQEIHREINTTGSKAADEEVSRRVVAVKAELEKVREIVLNIE